MCDWESKDSVCYCISGIYVWWFLAGRTHTCAVMERRLLDYYELGDVIGEGGFGSVCAGTCRQSGDTVSTHARPVTMGYTVHAVTCTCRIELLCSDCSAFSFIIMVATPVKEVYTFASFSWTACIYIYTCVYSTCENYSNHLLHGLQIYYLPLPTPRWQSKLFQNPKSSPGQRLGHRMCNVLKLFLHIFLECLRVHVLLVHHPSHCTLRCTCTDHNVALPHSVGAIIDGLITHCVSCLPHTTSSQPSPHVHTLQYIPPYVYKLKVKGMGSVHARNIRILPFKCP